AGGGRRGGGSSCHGRPGAGPSVVGSVSGRAPPSASACRSASRSISPSRRQPQVAWYRGPNGPPASPLSNPQRNSWVYERGIRSAGSPGGGGAGLLMLQWPPSCVETRWDREGRRGSGGGSELRREASRAEVGPVLGHVLQAGGAVGRAVRHGPAGRHVRKRRPERVLALVVDEHEIGGVGIVESAGHRGLSCLGVRTGVGYPAARARNWGCSASRAT